MNFPVCYLSEDSTVIPTVSPVCLPNSELHRRTELQPSNCGRCGCRGLTAKFEEIPSIGPVGSAGRGRFCHTTRDTFCLSGVQLKSGTGKQESSARGATFPRDAERAQIRRERERGQRIKGNNSYPRRVWICLCASSLSTFSWRLYAPKVVV